jgi:hypothetical protein
VRSSCRQPSNPASSPHTPSASGGPCETIRHAPDAAAPAHTPERHLTGPLRTLVNGCFSESQLRPRNCRSTPRSRLFGRSSDPGVRPATTLHTSTEILTSRLARGCLV